MKRILIIDDEKDYGFFIKQNLEATGDFQVDVCSDSTIAVKEAKELRPDLIILDFLMPGKSGIDILSELQAGKDTKNIPVIFLSAIIKEEELEKHKKLIGNGHFVSKPVKTEELVNAIMNLMEEQTQVKDKIRTVTFLSRKQIDFLDKIGKDALFYRGSKLSRSQILSELVDFLMALDSKGKRVDLKQESMSEAILKIFENQE